PQQTSPPPHIQTNKKRVSPDLEWHAACLKCAECNQYLDETCTCFVRDGKTYCKRDYIRYAIYIV
uniref:LIM zinc-binding domain-containing protein n=1 Tax=Cyanistes caeruleus TaxID=156563 RepID=A0A8C0V1G9_CYACU